MAGINVGTAWIEVLPSTNKLAPMLAKAMGGVERDAEAAGKRSGKGFTAGMGAIVAGGAIAGGLAVITKNAVSTRAEFGKTMNTVQGVTGIGEKALARMEKQAIDLGNSTVFSANEASEAMLELAKAGLKPAEIEAGGLEGTLKLAAAAGTDMATAATIAGNAMNTFGMKGKDMGKIADALAGGANRSTASVESLGEALSQVGPGAVNAGLDLNDTVGVLAAFDSAGIKGSDAGTSLKTMLARLSPQTAKASNMMKQLGLNFTNADGSFKSITEIAGQLNGALGGLSDSAKTDALNTLFGSDASRAASVLMKEGAEGIGEYIKATKDKGAADKAAEAGMKGMAGALERLSGAWETFMLQYGGGLEAGAVAGMDLLAAGIEKLGPAITIAGKGIGALVSAIVSAVNFVGRFADVFGVATAVLIAFNAKTLIFNARMLISLGVTKAQTIWTRALTVATRAQAIAQKLLNTALKGNPIGLVVTAITLLVGAFVILYKRNEGFRKLVNRVWSAVKTWIVGVWKNHLKPALQAFAKWFTGTAIPALKAFWSRGVKPVFTYVGNIIKTMWNRVVRPAFAAMKFYIQRVLAPVIKWLWSNAVKPAFRSIGSAIKIAWERIIKPALSRMGSLARALPAAFRAARDGISKAWNAIKAAVAKPINFVINTVWNDGLRKVINAIPGVKDLGRMGDIPGYSAGGWTGPGAKNKVAGVVHGDEFVVSKAARRKFEKSHPGALNYLNNYGELPGYKSGGRVWPLKGGVTSTYAGHSGVDLNAPNDYGAPVHAVTSGIAYPYSSSWAGNNSVRLVGGGTSQIYAHMMRRGKLGAVNAGDVIGYVGSEGNSTGPHLHFQISPMGYGPAMGFLQGATPPKGAAGAGSGFFDFAKNISAAKSGIQAAIKGVKSMSNSGWGALIKTGAKSLIGDAAGYAADKIPGGGLLKKLGVFDNGGVLEPGQLAYNASKRPEAVYNHKQFKQFAEAQTGAANGRVAMTITNWKTGEGYFTRIAENAVGSNADFDGMIARMG